MEEIKRKALEPDPSVKHRVELPGEVAAQLAQMREDNCRVAGALAVEKAKVERLTQVTKALYDVVANRFPGCGASYFSPLSYDTPSFLRCPILSAGVPFFSLLLMPALLHVTLSNLTFSPRAPLPCHSASSLSGRPYGTQR